MLHDSADRKKRSLYRPHSLVFILLAHHSFEECDTHCISLPILFRNKYLYLCARCSGIYTGLGLITIIQFLDVIRVHNLWRFILFVILGLPTTVDWFLYKLEIMSTTVFRRVGTGFFAGIALGMLAHIEDFLLLKVGTTLVYITLALVALIKAKKADFSS